MIRPDYFWMAAVAVCAMAAVDGIGGIAASAFQPNRRRVLRSVMDRRSSGIHYSGDSSLLTFSPGQRSLQRRLGATTLSVISKDEDDFTTTASSSSSSNQLRDVFSTLDKVLDNDLNNQPRPFQFRQPALGLSTNIDKVSDLYQMGQELAEAVDDLQVTIFLPNDDANKKNLILSSTLSITNNPQSPDVSYTWNATWTPPNAAWLRNLAQAWPGVTSQPVTYNHLAQQASTFSWNAVLQLFADALRTGQLKIPLACIEGRTTVRYASVTTERDDGNEKTATAATSKDTTTTTVITSITEELSYANDLQRGALQNRKCAQDLKLFLTLGRKPPLKTTFQKEDNDTNNEITDWKQWEDIVETRLPWASVPGMGVLDIEPLDDDDNGGVGCFLAITAASVLGLYASFLVPAWLGQGASHDIMMGY